MNDSDRPYSAQCHASLSRKIVDGALALRAAANSGDDLAEIQLHELLEEMTEAEFSAYLDATT